MTSTHLIPANFGERPVARRIPSLATAAALLSLHGCMVGPDYAPPAPAVPSGYGELAAGAAAGLDATHSDVAWWRLFDDAELASLVERAVAANKSLEVSEARVREARSLRESAQSLLYPRVGIGAAVLRIRGSEAALGIAETQPDAPAGAPPIDVPEPDLEGNLFQVGFDAQWTIDLFGGTRRVVEAARAREEGADSQRRGMVLIVVAETARAYLELRGVQRELEVAESTLRDQRQTLAVTRDRHAHGLASNLEVVRARTEVEATAAEIPPLEQAIREYVHVLSTVLALEPLALSCELSAPSPIPDAPDRIAVGVPSDLLRRRPDVQSAERRIAAATAMVGAATAQLFPQLVLGASGGFASRKLGDLFNGSSSDNPSTYYFGGPAINWTLFDAGRRRAAIERSEAEVDAVKAAYEDTVLRALREVESALVAVDRGRTLVANLQRLAASAREALSIALGDYRNGLLDQLTVLDAQRQANRADRLLVRGRVALMVNVVRLYEALGGGWELAERPAAAPHASESAESQKESK